MRTRKQTELEELVAATQKFADELDNAKTAPTAEDFTKLDGMVKDVMALKQAVKDEAERAGNLADAKSFLSSLGASNGGDNPAPAPQFTAAGLPAQPKGMTLGEMFVKSPAFEDFRGHYAGRDGVIPDSTKGINSRPFLADGKALVTGASDTSGGAFITPTQYGPVTDLVGARELTLRDLITVGATDSDTVEYVRITGRTNNAAPVPEATSSGQPAAYNAPTAGELTAGGYKPESGLALERVSTTVKTLAHWMPITKRAASDAGQVRTLVDNFLTIGLDEKLEDQIIGGSGAGENFQGILNAGIMTVGSAGTDLDAIVDAIRLVRVTGRRRPTAIVMHPNDWFSAGFLLAKDTAGNYLLGGPGAGVEAQALWGLRVVVSEAMTENTALVGDFRQAVLWEREGVTLSMSDSHLDFFTRNLLAVLAERRAAFGTLDSQAFATVTAV
jgi:HK97 family phage major capsid protein